MPEPGKNPLLIRNEERTVKDCIILSSRVYTNRALNLILAHYQFDTTDVNPNMMMRFDTRTINDICTFRMGESRREHWVVAACGDGYLRVLNLSKLVMVKAIKGVAGNPVCIDIAKTDASAGQKAEARDLIAVGYEDDSFIVYSLIQGFKPVFRGLGHRSFVSQVRFDNYYTQECANVQAKQASIEASNKRRVDESDWDLALLKRDQPQPKRQGRGTISQKVQHSQVKQQRKILPS